MKITLYDDASVFDDCCDDWHELLNDSAANQIFLTCDWQGAWWEAYHPGDLMVLVAMDEATGQWQGIAPWFIDTGDDGQRTVRTVGCVDVTDYLDIIARRGVEDEVYSALLAWLAVHQDDYDQVQLCNIPEGSLILDRLPALAGEHGFSVEKRLQDVCPVVSLPDDFRTYVGDLDSKNRHELRRKLRRAAGSASWHIVDPDAADLEQALEQFITLMTASSDEKHAFMQDEQNQRFFELMVPKVAAKGWLELAFLMAGDDPAAAYLNFVYNNRVLVYNSGHDAGEHGHLSPGIVLLARLIEHAIEEERSEFDFLRGDESYKYDMGGQDTNVYQLQLTVEE